jgi:MerR family transcriptional regulator, light-induced transcriptional regulator
MPQRKSGASPRTPRSAAEVISEHISVLAAEVVAQQYQAELSWQRYGNRGRARCIEDTEYHLEFLIEALNAGSAAQFVDYCGWAKILLTSRGIDVAHLIHNLKHIQTALRSKLSKQQFALADDYLRAGLKALPTLPASLPSLISPDKPYAEVANSYLQSLLLFDSGRASDIVLKASDGGASVKDIYRHIITPAQHEFGRMWHLGQLTVAHEHYCTAATEIVMAELFRHLVLSSPPRQRRVMCFCVEGERHCIGLKMFAHLLTLEGWDSTYVGADTPTSSAIQFISKEKPALIAVSVTFAKNVRSLDRLIRELRARPESEKMKVLIGGRATSSELCRRVGADAYAENIGDAVEITDRLVA